MKAKLVIGLFSFYFISGALLGCSNVRIVYPAETYTQVKSQLPNNVKLVEYEKGQLNRGYVRLNPDTGIYTIHCELWSAQCIRHELWHVNNWSKTHKDMPDHLKREWKVGG